MRLYPYDCKGHPGNIAERVSWESGCWESELYDSDREPAWKHGHLPVVIHETKTDPHQRKHEVQAEQMSLN